LNRFLITAALAAAVLIPSIAQAADAPPMATLACRPAASGEKSNATIGGTALLCRKLDTAKIAADMAEMHAMAGQLSGTQKEHMMQDMSQLYDQFHFPKYPGQYPNNEYG
jgi:hypothetical protein